MGALNDSVKVDTVREKKSERKRNELEDSKTDGERNKEKHAKKTHF